MKLKKCPESKGLCKGCCKIEIIETMAKPPKNIRIGCIAHSFWLKDSFSSLEEATEAWNRAVSLVT